RRRACREHHAAGRTPDQAVHPLGRDRPARHRHRGMSSMRDATSPMGAPHDPAPAIPGTLNLAIAAGAIVAAVACLWVAAHAPHWSVLAAAAFAFSFVNNTIFSLQHECVHGTFPPARRINEAAGVLFAAFFPTAFAIQRVSHIGHHRRNRTDLELYDYYLPHQSRWLKTYW